MQQQIIHQIPTPTLVVRPQQGRVPVTLIGRTLRRNPYDGHRAQRPFPNNLPGVSAPLKAHLAPGPVGGLGHGVAVEGEAVALEVDVAGAVLGVPGVEEGAELGLVGGRGGEEVEGESGGGEAAGGVVAPRVVVLVREELVPVRTDVRDNEVCSTRVLCLLL